jgi:hypothetical protein
MVGRGEIDTGLFDDVTGLANTILDSREQITALTAEIGTANVLLRERREDFLANYGNAIAAGTLRESMGDENFFRIIATIGRDRHSDPDETRMTSVKTAAVIGELHEPGTLVAAYSYDWEKGIRGAMWRRWSIGTVSEVPNVTIDAPASSYRFADLIFRVPLLSPNDKPHGFTVSVSEIAEQFTKDKTGRYPEMPVVVTGVEAVNSIAKEHFPDEPCHDSEIYYKDRERRFITALGRSGITLKDIGFEEEYIDGETSRIQDRVSRIFSGSREYSQEMLRLAVVTGNETALSLFENLLGDRNPYDIGSYLNNDMGAVEKHIKGSLIDVVG